MQKRLICSLARLTRALARLTRSLARLNRLLARLNRLLARLNRSLSRLTHLLAPHCWLHSRARSAALILHRAHEIAVFVNEMNASIS